MRLDRVRLGGRFGSGSGFGFGGGGGAPLPTISIAGTTLIGETLTATATNTTSYEWRRGGVAIGGATASTYDQVAADMGLSITCEATGPGGSAESNALAFVPSQIAAYHADYDPDLGVTLVGDGVSVWADQSGNARDATQGTAGNRPFFSAAGGPGGHDAIDFVLRAGAVTQLLTGDIGLTATTTVCMVVQSPASGRYAYDGSTLNTRGLLNNTSQIRMYAGAFGPSIAAPVDGTWIVDVGVFNGASSKQTIDGGTAATGNVSTGTSAGMTLGSASSATAGFGLNVKMGRAIIYSAALSDANRLNVEAYLDNWRDGAI